MAHRQILVMMFASIALLGACGSDDSSSAEADPTTTEATAPDTTYDPDTGSPYDVLDDSTRECVEDALSQSSVDPTELAACMDMDDLVEVQRAYLASETAATVEQIDCVESTMRDLSIEEARSLVDSGIGQAVYVPCGLPD